MCRVSKYIEYRVVKYGCRKLYACRIWNAYSGAECVVVCVAVRVAECVAERVAVQTSRERHALQHQHLILQCV